MIFIDTAFLIAYAVPTDVLHARAHQWGNGLSEGLLTTDFVLCEFVNFLSKPKDRRRAATVLHWLWTDPGIKVIDASRVWFDAGFVLHSQREDKEWSLTDCISFEVMKTAGVTRALTHDHHFEQAGFEALLRRDPS